MTTTILSTCSQTVSVEAAGVEDGLEVVWSYSPPDDARPVVQLSCNLSPAFNELKGRHLTLPAPLVQTFSVEAEA